MQDARRSACTPASPAADDVILHVDQRLFCCAISPSGDTLVAGGEGPELFIVDVASRECRCVDGHPGTTIEALSFLDTEGKTLVSLAGDGSLATWDTSTWKAMARHRAHERGIFAATIDGSRALLLTGSLDGTIGRWTLPALDPAGSTRAPGHGILAISILDDCRVAREAFGTASGRIGLIDDQGAVLTTWKAHDGPVFAIRPAGDRGIVFTSGADGHVKTWSIDDQRLVVDFDARQGKVLDVHIEGTGDETATVASAGGDGTVKRWLVDLGAGSWHHVATMHHHARTVEQLVAGTDDDWFSVSSEGTVRTWNWP